MTTPPRRALVTGAAHRIGRAIATDLAAHGYDVVIHANRSDAAARKLAVELAETHGVKTATVRADLTDPASVETLLPAAIEAVGPLSLLVNNASVFEADTIADLASARWRRQMAINAEAPAHLTRAFAAAGCRGLVVNMIDQRVWKPTPLYLSYSASKATLWWLTQTLAQALAPDIRVVALGPGPVLKSAAQTEREFADLVATLPLHTAPQLDEFGATIRFLHATPSITGQMIALDGGQHLAWRTPDAVVPE
ncbi:SDR family oxidoreductase [Acuticoccus sp. M5D2P5]|uniref:SDR family oxidoreductase n=1 Tax=Acuticoccus kalidii TaxID=2910977 RepID=UPI001F41F75E|nr:SDR family oxidoreductase [Acuticoccus kalidii]MCF3932165.1 SDR family oxidoreductase [Acuticoccus kalidii]